MNRTEYYKLYLPEQYDDYDVDVFNENAQIIDQTLHDIHEEAKPPGDLGRLGMGYCIVDNFTDGIAHCYIPQYVLTKGGQVTLKFAVNVPANAKLNISGQGEYPIYYHGSPIAANQILSGTTADLTFDGDTYDLISAGATSSVGGMFVGTTAEYQEALAHGLIIDNMIVAITDDFETQTELVDKVNELNDKVNGLNDKFGYPVQQ